MNLDDYIEQIKELTRELRTMICPVWQCGGELEILEDEDWQTPNMTCLNCGAKYTYSKN